MYFELKVDYYSNEANKNKHTNALRYKNINKTT